MQPEDMHQEIQRTQYVYVRQYTYVRYGANPHMTTRNWS